MHNVPKCSETLKILQQKLQDFSRVSNHFGTLYIKGLTYCNPLLRICTYACWGLQYVHVQKVLRYIIFEWVVDIPAEYLHKKYHKRPKTILGKCSFVNHFLQLWLFTIITIFMIIIYNYDYLPWLFPKSNTTTGRSL